VDKFHGIDIDESAVHIATLALWLVDHQMNLNSIFKFLSLEKQPENR
jgi:hypothetical protein